MPEFEAALFDVFNARHLPPEDVARTFVPPPCFAELTGRSHTVLVGPRGSGKTTLLKMLQPQALGVWKHDEAEKYRAAINYVGVFVPADISWGAQLEALGYGRLSREAHDVLSTASFTTHVLKALLEVMAYRLEPPNDERQEYLKVVYAGPREAELSADLASLWKLSPRIPSLLALKHALRQRMMDIRALANRGAILDKGQFSAELADLHFLHLHFIESVAASVEVFNDVVQESTRNWAILFDELEIAPEWLQDEVIRSTRSVNQRLFLKLALSPFSSSARKLLENTIAPAPGEDLIQIPLWYAEREKGEEFCRQLWRATIDAYGADAQDATKALGTSYFESENSDQYGINSAWSDRFKSLARRDRSFARYLADHQIDPAHLDATPVWIRDRTVRKAAPIVAVREFFRKDDSATQAQRSRKSDALYAGASSVFAITEGNPRWFKALANGFVRYIATNGLPVPAAVQGSEIRKSAERFLAMLATAPAAEIGGRRAHRPTLPRVLDAIGTYFFSRVVLDDFNPEPPLSFRVGEHTDPFLLELLQIALNRGAIVYAPDGDAESVLTSLAGKRFRLCYLLAAYYGLPLRLGKETPLEKALSQLNDRGARTEDLFA